MEGSLSARARWMTCKTIRKANWDKTLQKSLKFSYCRKSIRKQIRSCCRKNLSTSFFVCLVSWKQRNLEIPSYVPKWCRRPVVSLLYATKSAFTAPNLCWACALAFPVTFLTGDHVMQIGFGQISPSASSTRDLGTRLVCVTLMTISFWLRYAQAPTNYLGPPHTSRQCPTRGFEI